MLFLNDISSVSEADANLFRCKNQLIFRGYHFQLACTLFQRYTFDLAVYHTDHYAVSSVNDGLGCTCTDPCGKYTVIWTRLATSLCMSRNCNTYFTSDLLEDLISDFIGN